MQEDGNRKQPHICIIVGGAAGLSMGYFLKQQGYRHITILEKEARVGGKCLSITYAGKSFDLGANYITSSYRQVKRLARKFGMRYYTEGQLNAYDGPSNRLTSLREAILSHTSFWKLAGQSLRYFYKRWQLNSVLSTRRPGYKGIAAHPELTQSFGNWLTINGLPDLAMLFQIPISLMGYGQLNEIPAAYGLTSMSLGTFADLMLAAFSTRILGYPKRFTEGYQRLWERISWGLDVLPGAQVLRVTRGGKRIVVEFAVQEELLRPGRPARETLVCDRLVIAVPLFSAALEPFMDLNPAEKALFKQVIYDPYVVTTYQVSGMEAFTAVTYMLPEPEIGHPFVVTRQFADTDLISFYTRASYDQPVHKETILLNNAAFARRAAGVELGDYYTFSEFPYFPHVGSESMANGFYDELEALQGRQNTFYTGGLMNFELVETIVNYSRHLVKNHFLKQPSHEKQDFL